MLSVRECQELAKKQPFEVYLKVRNLDLKEATRWVRDFQESQANYSKVVGKFDATAIRLQEIYLLIYKKVMRAYILYMTKQGMKDRPWMPKEKIKLAAKIAWGQYMKGVNY